MTDFWSPEGGCQRREEGEAKDVWSPMKGVMKGREGSEGGEVDEGGSESAKGGTNSFDSPSL